jgi:DNA-binding response OmpR family regulator
MSKPHVLIIDDDIEYLSLLSDALEDKFEVRCASNLTVVDNILKEGETFDIALIDEHINNDKGSEWIKLQQDNFSENSIEKPAMSFVLYSGLATEDTMLKGLDCGADDFLSKPISIVALRNKLQQLIAYQQKIINYENDIESKNNVINISMAQASKYGSCMQLTSKLNQCFDIEQLKNAVFSYFNSMGLHGCLAFYPLNETPAFYHSQKGTCSPVEIEVMELLKVKSRLFRFGSRTIFNHSLASILILNLEDGTVDTDIYIDALASVIECIGARMEFIAYKNSLINVQVQIQQAVSTTKRMVEISKKHQQEIMNEIVINLGTSFHVLDLTIGQEDYLTNLVHGALRKHSQDDVNFMEITSALDGALISVDQLKAINTEQQITEEAEEEDELF